jgi:hypothetical protein
MYRKCLFFIISLQKNIHPVTHNPFKKLSSREVKTRLVSFLSSLQQMTAGELQQLIFDPQQQAFVDQAFADQQQQQAFADQQQQQHPQEAYPDRRYADDHRGRLAAAYTDQMQFDQDRDRSYREGQRLPGRLLGDQQAARLAGNLAASPPWRSRKLEEGGEGVDSNDLQSSLDQSQHRVSTVSSFWCVATGIVPFSLSLAGLES